MITDRIGRHEVLLPINHNYNKICDIFVFVFKLKHKKFREFFAGSEKKPFKCARARGGTYCLITWAWRVLSFHSVVLVLKSGQLIAKQILEFCFSNV